MKSLKDIGKRLDEIKKHFSYTNEQLGEVCGVSYAAIRKIINGETKDPSISIVMHLSQNLGINLKWLLFEEGEMFDRKSGNKKNSPDAPSSFIRSHREKEEYLRLILKSKEEQMNILEKMLRFVEHRNAELEKQVHPVLHQRKKAS